MKNYKFIFYIVILPVVCLLFFSSCNLENLSETDVYLQEWYEQANLDAQETPAELYEKALQEQTLVIYSITTRIFDVAESFEAEYPGLTVEIYDNRAPDLINFIEDGYLKNDFQCDIVVCTDETGEIREDFLPKHIVNTYVPHDIEPYLTASANGELLSFVGEFQQLFYNSEVYAECPIDNWWELTELQWKDNIYINSPLRSESTISFLHSLFNNESAMTQAYIARYGKEPELLDGETSSELFIKLLIENGLKQTNSSNELVEIVGAPNQTNPPLAFMISSKIRMYDLGYDIQPAYGVLPSDGTFSPNNVMIAGGSKNVNTAKLFIRWLLGESDGTGEGLTPYLQEGTWPVRTDVECPSEVTLEEGNFWYNDDVDISKSYENIMEFWQTLND